MCQSCWTSLLNLTLQLILGCLMIRWEQEFLQCASIFVSARYCWCLMVEIRFNRNLQLTWSFSMLYPFPPARDQILGNAREEVKAQVRLLTAHLVGRERYIVRLLQVYNQKLWIRLKIICSFAWWLFNPKQVYACTYKWFVMLTQTWSRSHPAFIIVLLPFSSLVISAEIWQWFHFR